MRQFRRRSLHASTNPRRRGLQADCGQAIVGDPERDTAAHVVLAPAVPGILRWRRHFGQRPPFSMLRKTALREAAGIFGSGASAASCFVAWRRIRIRVCMSNRVVVAVSGNGRRLSGLTTKRPARQNLVGRDQRFAPDSSKAKRLLRPIALHRRSPLPWPGLASGC